MTDETITEKLTQIEAAFNTKKAEQNKAQLVVDETEKELLRLQGEYRAYQSMQTPLSQAGTALTITAVEDTSTTEPKKESVG